MQCTVAYTIARAMNVQNVAKLTLLFADPKNSVLDLKKKIKFVEVPDNVKDLPALRESVRTNYTLAVEADAPCFPKRFKQMNPVILGKNAVILFLFINAGIRHNQEVLSSGVFRDAVDLHSAIMDDVNQFRCYNELHQLHNESLQQMDRTIVHSCSACADTLMELIYADTLLTYMLIQDDALDLRDHAWQTNSYIKLRLMMMYKGLSYDDIKDFPWMVLSIAVHRNIIPEQFTKNVLAEQTCGIDLVFSSEEEEAQKDHHIELFSPYAPPHESVVLEDGTISCEQCDKLVKIFRNSLDFYLAVNNMKVFKSLLNFPQYGSHALPLRGHEGDVNKCTYPGLPTFSITSLGNEFTFLKLEQSENHLVGIDPSLKYAYTEKRYELYACPDDPEKKMIWNLCDKNAKYNVHKDMVKGYIDGILNMKQVLGLDVEGYLSAEEAMIHHKFQNGSLQNEFEVLGGSVEQITMDVRFPPRGENKFLAQLPYVLTTHEGKVKKHYKKIDAPKKKKNDADEPE